MGIPMEDQVTALEGMGVDTDVVEGSMWRHRKGGDYKVLAVGRIESDLSPVVVYQSQKDWLVWVRPLAEFEDGRFDEIPAEE